MALTAPWVPPSFSCKASPRTEASRERFWYSPYSMVQ